MPTFQPEPCDINEILTSRRIGAAYGALNDPSRGGSDDALRLSQDEREVIRQALSQSPHPLAGFAHHLVDQWDHTEPDDQVAELLLLREICVGEKRQRDRNLGRSPGPGLTR
ncbi:MAG: hypothetical protein IH941_13610 [Acidobacteria bacterium]|nr:hypothetical protein [Acidobacteriota bacterium]